MHNMKRIMKLFLVLLLVFSVSTVTAKDVRAAENPDDYQAGELVPVFSAFQFLGKTGTNRYDVVWQRGGDFVNTTKTEVKVIIDPFDSSYDTIGRFVDGYARENEYGDAVFYYINSADQVYVVDIASQFWNDAIYAGTVVYGFDYAPAPGNGNYVATLDNGLYYGNLNDPYSGSNWEDHSTIGLPFNSERCAVKQLYELADEAVYYVSDDEGTIYEADVCFHDGQVVALEEKYHIDAIEEGHKMTSMHYDGHYLYVAYSEEFGTRCFVEAVDTLTGKHYDLGQVYGYTEVRAMMNTYDCAHKVDDDGALIKIYEENGKYVATITYHCMGCEQGVTYGLHVTKNTHACVNADLYTAYVTAENSANGIAYTASLRVSRPIPPLPPIPDRKERKDKIDPTPIFRDIVRP